MKFTNHIYGKRSYVSFLLSLFWSFRDVWKERDPDFLAIVSTQNLVETVPLKGFKHSISLLIIRTNMIKQLTKIKIQGKKCSLKLKSVNNCVDHNKDMMQQILVRKMPDRFSYVLQGQNVLALPLGKSSLSANGGPRWRRRGPPHPQLFSRPAPPLPPPSKRLAGGAGGVQCFGARRRDATQSSCPRQPRVSASGSRVFSKALTLSTL